MKVVGIGLGRTGTRSLAFALEALGYKTKHCPGFHLDENNNLIINQNDVSENQAATDETTIPIYKEIDAQYPGSKFILTIRDMDSWYRSIENNGNALQHIRDKNPAVAVLHKTLYGSAVRNIRLYTEAHQNHIASVKEYFSNRPNDLLIMNICSGEGWETLCPFLGKDIPDTPFPKENIFGINDLASVLKKKALKENR
jgi:hypothetical protein